MARVSRKCLNEMYYHVMVQGIGKLFIFKEKTMKMKYLELVREKAAQNQIEIVAYCVMGNHVHLLLKAVKSEHLSKMMAQVNTSFGKYYNYMKHRVGFVFRDRYRAEPILDRTHLLNCIRYIHDNPVKAKMVTACEQYAFSSICDYLKGTIAEETVKEVFGSYQEALIEISGEYEKYDFIEVNNEFGRQKYENFEKVSQEYQNLDFSSAETVYQVSKMLKKRCGASNQQIYMFMGLKRTAYYDRLKKMKRTWGRPLKVRLRWGYFCFEKGFCDNCGAVKK